MCAYQQLLDHSSFTLHVAVYVVGSILVLPSSCSCFAWRPDMRRLGRLWRNGVVSWQRWKVSRVPKCDNGRIRRKIMVILDWHTRQHRNQTKQCNNVTFENGGQLYLVARSNNKLHIYAGTIKVYSTFSSVSFRHISKLAKH